MTTCFVANLLSHVDVGHVLVVGGVLRDEGQKFKIQFLSNGENTDVVTPLEIQADAAEEGRITLSTEKCNGCEEKSETFDVKVVCDDLSFKFYILILDDNFRIALNGEHLCSFTYRCKLSAIKVIKIAGDVECVKQVDHRQVYPFCWPPNHEDFPHAAFSADSPCRFTPNTLIILRLTPTGDERGSFFIRFNEMGSKKQLFHFNPRFAEREIICNSMNDRLEWQTEARFPNFPFVLNEECQLGIFMDSSFFQVAVNGNHILRYPFKTVQSTMLSAKRSHSIYDKLTGFKIFALNGLQVRVSYVDFFSIQESDSKFYEIFSNLNFI